MPTATKCALRSASDAGSLTNALSPTYWSCTKYLAIRSQRLVPFSSSHPHVHQVFFDTMEARGQRLEFYGSIEFDCGAISMRSFGNR